MKRPLRSGTRLLRSYAVKVLLVTVACLKERLEVVLLNLLSDELLQRLRLEELVGFLPALVPKPMRSLGREREKELRPIEDAYQQGESKSIHQPDHHNTKHYDSRHSP